MENETKEWRKYFMSGIAWGIVMGAIITSLMAICMDYKEISDLHIRLVNAEEHVKEWERYGLWNAGWIEGYRDGRNGKSPVTSDNIGANNPEARTYITLTNTYAYRKRLARWMCGYMQGYRDGTNYKHRDGMIFYNPDGVHIRGDYGDYNHCKDE